MSDYLIWLIVALVILGCEMMLGTIYLLAFSAGALAACISALFGLSLRSQKPQAEGVPNECSVLLLPQLSPFTACISQACSELVFLTSVLGQLYIETAFFWSRPGKGFKPAFGSLPFSPATPVSNLYLVSFFFFFSSWFVSEWSRQEF